MLLFRRQTLVRMASAAMAIPPAATILGIVQAIDPAPALWAIALSAPVAVLLFSVAQRMPRPQPPTA
jgi:hypothetical protein